MPEGPYKPGGLIPRSGLYSVKHALHRSDHEVTLIAGQVFPPCARCGNEVRFRLISGGHLADEDADFKRKRKAKGRH